METFLLEIEWTNKVFVWIRFSGLPTPCGRTLCAVASELLLEVEQGTSNALQLTDQTSFLQRLVCHPSPLFLLSPLFYLILYTSGHF